MSKRVDKSWIVFDSIENFEANRCVDLFRRPDGSWGFKELRRDPEDAGEWTPTHYFSGANFRSADMARSSALACVCWLAEALGCRKPG